MSASTSKYDLLVKSALAVALCITTFVIIQADERFLLGFVGFLVIALLLPVGDWLIIPFFGLLTGAVVPMNERPIEVAGIQFYGADGILVLMASLVVVLWMKGRSVDATLQARTPFDHRILKVHGLFFCWGLVALGLGLFVYHYPARDAIGTFRRLFFYSLALPLVILMPLNRRHLHLLPPAIWAAFLLVAATGLYRLATGQTWHEQAFVFEATTPSPRLLSYTECATLTMALAYCVALLRARRKRLQKLAAIPAAGLSMVLLLIGGWRLGAVYALAVPLAVLVCISWLRRERLVGFIKVPAVAFALFAICSALASLVFQDAFKDAYEQFLERINSFSPQTDLRYYIWKESFRQFALHPLFGTGLGHTLVFAAMSTGGVFFMRESSTHNTVLTILYQTGFPGITLFITLHASFALYALKKLRALAPINVAPHAALMALYFCSLGFSLLQPLQVGSIVALYLAMGLVLALLRTGQESAEEAGNH